MKKINFIRTISPVEQRSLHRWFVASSVAGILLLITLSTLTIYYTASYYQINRTYKRTQYEQQPFLKQQEQLTSLTKQEEALTQRVQLIDEYTKKSNEFSNTCLEILKGLSSTITLRSLFIEKKQFKLEANATTLSDAATLAEKLNTNKVIQTCHLATLNKETTTNTITFTIIGTLA